VHHAWLRHRVTIAGPRHRHRYLHMQASVNGGVPRVARRLDDAEACDASRRPGRRTMRPHAARDRAPRPRSSSPVDRSQHRLTRSGNGARAQRPKND
jgi:hypothetical protein